MAYRGHYDSSSSDENDTFSRDRPNLRSDRYSLPPTTSIERMNTPLTTENSPTFSGFRKAVITPLEPELMQCPQEPDEIFQESAEYSSIDVKTKGKKKYKFGGHKRQFAGNRFSSSKRSLSPTYQREGVISPIPVHFLPSEFQRFKQQSKPKPIPPSHPRSISGTSMATVEKPYEESVAHRKLQYTPESFEPCGPHLEDANMRQHDSKS